jgi:PII-like signaling protein
MGGVYVNIRVHTSEKDRYEGKPVAQAVVHYLHGLKIGARCAVFRGEEGLYETGEISKDSITDLSYHLPLLIEILVPGAEAERVVERLKVLVPHGWIGVTPTRYERAT